nr:MAG TPA: hypothetical protein [Caudoviricetes sp.]
MLAEDFLSSANINILRNSYQKKLKLQRSLNKYVAEEGQGFRKELNGDEVSVH